MIAAYQSLSTLTKVARPLPVVTFTLRPVKVTWSPAARTFPASPNWRLPSTLTSTQAVSVAVTITVAGTGVGTGVGVGEETAIGDAVGSGVAAARGTGGGVRTLSSSR